MAAHTYKLIELVGTSPTSTDEAIRNAIQKASATIKHIDWFQVIESRRPTGCSPTRCHGGTTPTCPPRTCCRSSKATGST